NLESEFWNHKMVWSDIDGHMARFHELASSKIKLHVTSSEPATIQVVVSMANRLTTDGIKDGLFKKKENAGNKRRSNDQNRNRGRDDRNKRRRTGGNFALTISEQGQGQRQYAGQHPNPPNETADEVAQKLNIALPNLLTQLVEALGGNRIKKRDHFKL
nr:hypothetical protein [Tanacetum cinerariifolium]